MLLTFFTIFGSLNYGLMSFNYNIIEIISKKLKINISKFLYIIIAISAIILALDITTWLPFLGKSILPSNLLPLQIPSKPDTFIKINTSPNTKIAYWASDKKYITDVKNAYGEYKNSGIVLSDKDGIAILPIIKGEDYIVPSNKIIKKHVHYRTLGGEYEMMGKIETVFV
jgi:uncharacterized membrane protein YuzA (DUF378 family)